MTNEPQSLRANVDKVVLPPLQLLGLIGVDALDHSKIVFRPGANSAQFRFGTVADGGEHCVGSTCGDGAAGNFPFRCFGEFRFDDGDGPLAFADIAKQRGLFEGKVLEVDVDRSSCLHHVQARRTSST